MEEKRGKKSKAELEALATVSALPTPPPAPSTLNAAGRKRWRAIVNEHGADRFRKSDIKLIEQLIASEQLADEMREIIKEQGSIIGTGEDNRPMENPACKILNRTVVLMMALQVKLRLCPSTRMRAEKGLLQRPKPKARPWE